MELMDKDFYGKLIISVRIEVKQSYLVTSYQTATSLFWCCKLCLGSYRKYLSLWDLPTELPGVSNKEVIISEHCPVPKFWDFMHQPQIKAECLFLSN